MPAPAPMQFMPLQYAQSPDIGKQLGGLGGALGKAGNTLMPGANPLTAGSAVPGAQDPTSVGGPGGPMPLVTPGTPGPGAAVGQAGNPAAGQWRRERRRYNHRSNRGKIRLPGYCKG